MDIASLYHLRLVEAHPKYLACQRGSAKAGAKPQLSRNMKRDVEVEIAREVASPSFEDFLMSRIRRSKIRSWWTPMT
ncbi:hypothetical protein OXX69_013864 [Metschnikowia pulcherrima]